MPNNGWSIALGYDYRFGAMRISPVSPEGNRVADFMVNIAELLRAARIAPHEMRAYLELAAQPPSELIGDVEPIRFDTIEKTNMKGKTVLDIGGYDGVMARKALDGGAKRAICLDNQQYHHYGWEDKKFPGVEYITGDFTSWTEPVDVVIFYNVLYHLKNPWAGLDKVRELVKPNGIMLLCTLFRYHDGSWMYIYEPRECNPTDDTVYFGPSIMALERLLTATGWTFKQEGLALDRVVYTCKPVKNWQRKHENT